MEYNLENKQTDPIALLQILQSRFSQFDRTIIKWKYEGKIINEKFLEEKIINIYSGKSKATNDNVQYSDWIHIFDEGLKKIITPDRLPILFFSGGKDSTFIASRLIANKIKALYFSFADDFYTKNIVTQLSEKLKIKVYFTDEKLKHLDLQDILLNLKEPVLDPAGVSLLYLYDKCLSLGYKFSDVLFFRRWWQRYVYGSGAYQKITSERISSKNIFQA